MFKQLEFICLSEIYKCFLRFQYNLKTTAFLRDDAQLTNPVIDSVVKAAQFLCSYASSYLNGQNIVMDGGRSVW